MDVKQAVESPLRGPLGKACFPAERTPGVPLRLQYRYSGTLALPACLERPAVRFTATHTYADLSGRCGALLSLTTAHAAVGCVRSEEPEGVGTFSGLLEK